MKRKLWFTLILAFLLGAGVAVAQPGDEQSYPGPTDQNSQNQDLKHVSVQGKIERITDQSAVLRTQDGKEVTVHLGPEAYWRDKNYHLNTGAQVTVDGWGEIYDQGGSFIYAGRISGNGYSIELMDSRGYPMWADQGEEGDVWYPSYSVFELYFGSPWGYGPWGYWGSPPYWWHRPMWWHERPHYRPYRPWSPPPRPPHHHPQPHERGHRGR
jgi:hypothetical protein